MGTIGLVCLNTVLSSTLDLQPYVTDEASLKHQLWYCKVMEAMFISAFKEFLSASLLSPEVDNALETTVQVF